MIYLALLSTLLLSKIDHTPQNNYKIVKAYTIELNHVIEVDQVGQSKIALVQLLFWDFNFKNPIKTYYIMDYYLVFYDNQGRLEVPHFYKTNDGKWKMIIEMFGDRYVVVADNFNKTYTLHDKELDDRLRFGSRNGIWHK